MPRELAAVKQWLPGVIEALKTETERLDDTAEHRRTRPGGRDDLAGGGSAAWSARC